MRRVLIVPAAGRGTRLGSPLPKLLTPVADTAMIDHVLRRHAPHVALAVVIVHPDDRPAVDVHFSNAVTPIELIEQPTPTGMLDAILLARDVVAAARPDRVWISWCDQVAISDGTVRAIVTRERDAASPAVVMPAVRQSPPYIHFERDEDGRLTAVRQRREGDAMPDVGESDAGLFSLAADVYLTELFTYAVGALDVGTGSQERNFLPFLPWLAPRAEIVTFDVDPAEARGINTPQDLAALDAELRMTPPRA